MNNHLHKAKTRYVVIEPQGKLSALRAFPNLSPTISPTLGELNNDDLLLVGYQKDLMHAILNNAARVGWLLVLDRTGVDYVFLHGPQVETFYAMNDLKDNNSFKYPEERIISYARDGLHIPYVPDFEHLNAHARLKVYSDMRVMKEFLNVLSKE
jgi:hypothetical protein